MIIGILSITVHELMKDFSENYSNGFNTELPEPKDNEIESSKTKAYENPESYSGDDLYNMQYSDSLLISSTSHTINKGSGDHEYNIHGKQTKRDTHAEHSFSNITETRSSSSSDYVRKSLNAISKNSEINPKQEQNKSIKDDNLNVKTTNPDSTLKHVDNVSGNELESSHINSNYDNKRHRQFISAKPESIQGSNGKIAITACIHGDQKINDGGRVRIRTLETISISGVNIHKGTILTGIAHFNNTRVGIEISSIRTNKNIIPVNIKVYDNDAQEGLYYPESKEEKSMKSTGRDITRKIGESIAATGIVGSIISGGIDYVNNNSSSRTIFLTGEYKIYLLEL